MKVLFSADWHIRLGQKNVPKTWQKNRYNLFFDKIENIECDLHIIGGDVFDKLPTLEELQLFFDFVSDTKHRTIIFDGNHEATKKGKTFLSLLSNIVSTINNKVSITDISMTVFDEDKNPVLDILPYTELHNVEKLDNSAKTLCTHVRGEIPPHVKPEIDLELFNRWDKVLAGDLHSYTNCQRNILYPGSPMTTSFHRTEDTQNGVIVYDTDTLEHKWLDLALPKLIRKRVSSQEEIVKTEYNHTIYEVETNAADVANIEDNELIDKRIVYKKSEPSMDFSGETTIGGELSLYLTSKLGLEGEQLEELMGEFYDNYSES